MATIVERLELLITSSAAGAVTGLRQTEAAAGTLDTKAKGLTGSLQKMGISGNVAGGVMAAGIVGGSVLAGAAIGKFVLDGVSKFAELTSEVRSLQRVMGGSAEDASRLAAAARITGTDIDALGKGFFQLGRRIADGKDTLDNFGVTVAHNQDGTINLSETLIRAAEGYQAIGDGAHKSQFLMENFGRAGATLGPLLAKTRGELEAIFAEADKNHEIFSQDQLNKGREYQEAMRELHSAITGLQISIGQELIPMLTGLARTLTVSIQVLNNFGDALDNVQSKIPGAGLFGKWSDAVTGLGKSVFLGGAILGEFGHSSDAAKEAQDRLTEAEKNLQKVVLDGSSTHKERVTAQKEYAAANEAVAHMQDQVNTAMQNSVGVTGAATTATQAQTDALNAELAAQKASAAAIQNLYDVTIALSNAKLGLEGAELNVESASAAYNKAVEDGTADSLEARQAHNQLETAVRATAAAAAEATADQIALGGGTATTSEKLAAQRGELEVLKQKFPELTPIIDGYLFELGQIPQSKTTTMYADTKPADIAIANYRAQLDALGRDITTQIYAGIFGGVTRQHGGPIPGGANQAVPILAHGGEYVLSEDVVSRIKGGRPSRGAKAAHGDWWPGNGGAQTGNAGPQVIQLVVSGRVLAEVTAAEFGRAGGPQLSPRAIA